MAKFILYANLYKQEQGLNLLKEELDKILNHKQEELE